MEVKLKESYLLFLLLFLLKIDLVNLIATNNIRNLKNFNSEIHLVIRGNGMQQILSDSFHDEPNQVVVNGVKYDSCKKRCHLNSTQNKITLIFKSQMTSCSSMFEHLNNIIEIDLSEFDFFKVSSMKMMFNGCSNLEKINFGNKEISSVENMDSLFNGCAKLISVDLSNFDTSKVASMKKMFYGCVSLKYLNLYSFKIKTKINLENIFDGVSSEAKYCIKDGKIKKFLLGNDKISDCSFMLIGKKRKVGILDGIVDAIEDAIDDVVNEVCAHLYYKYKGKCVEECPYCTSSHENNECFEKPNCYFDTYSNQLKECFQKCKSCDTGGDEINHNCKECADGYKFLNELNNKNCYEKCNYYYYFDANNKYQCTQIRSCPQNYNKLIPNDGKCIDECKKDNNYSYEYQNYCFSSCPPGTHKKGDNDDYMCYIQAPVGYYLDSFSSAFKKCYETCSECDKRGDATNNNCSKCKSGFEFYTNLNNISNCYEKCFLYYYFDDSNEFHCNKTCPQKYNKLIIEKNKCIDDCKRDEMFKYEFNNICYQKCPNGTYLLEDNKDNLCYNNSPIGYYFNQDSEMYKKCYETCSECDKGGNETNNNCLECKINYTFYTNLLNITNCYPNCSFYYYFNELNEFHCTENCQGKYNKSIIEKSKCIDDCKRDDIYRYVFNNICYQKCPNGTYILEDQEDLICYDHVLDGYYLDSKNEIYKKCYETCNVCNKGGNETNNNCLECKMNYSFYTDLLNISNCYPNCSKYFYFNESNDFQCTDNCQGKYNKLIIEKNKCTDDCKKDEMFRYEYNNTCYQKCPNGTYPLEDDENNKCFDYNPNGYYLDSKNEIYKKCYETCSECDKGGDLANNNCLKCKVNYTFYTNLLNISNCYPNCSNYYYFNELNEFQCTEKCKGKYNKLIIEKSK